jgi:mannose-6-phosphate isomerase-like protein (cupin superfamily)
MKEPGDSEPYRLDLQKGQAAVTGAGTWFQLQNSGEALTEVLYIVSPAYVFEMQGNRIVHDDAVLVAKSWEEVAAIKHASANAEVVYEARASREEAMRRLAKRKGVAVPRLADNVPRSLTERYAYLAPDTSEIRLLANGERGGFAHCLLPAGRVSSAVRHRTVEELWYVLEGEGEIWQARDNEERIDAVRPGDSIRIRVDTAFQFRAGHRHDLKLLLATMPPWPGPEEAVSVNGKWS